MRLKTLFTVAVVSLLVLSSLSGLAAAQDNETNTNETAVPESEDDELEESSESETEDVGEEEEKTTYLIEIDHSTRVVDAEWDDGTVTFTVETDRPRVLTITDASVEIVGAVDIKQEQVTVPSGTSTIQFTVENPKDPAVTVATPDGLIGLGEQSSSYLFSGPATWDLVRTSGLAGALAGVGSVLAIAWIRVSSKDDEHERVI